LALAGILFGAAMLLPLGVLAHCDTMDGPVVLAAKAALEKRDVTPVLKWVQKHDEAQIEAAFTKTLAVRTKGPEARDLADQYFFETLVRLHRAGEGAPYTGIKPAGTPLEPAVAEADKALDSGSVENLVKLITQDASTGIRKRFAEVQEKKAHAEHNVEAGREFVAAYVEYVHYVEALQKEAQGSNSHHEHGDKPLPMEQAHQESAPSTSTEPGKNRPIQSFNCRIES
jgi:hypothetical protein